MTTDNVAEAITVGGIDEYGCLQVFVSNPKPGLSAADRAWLYKIAPDMLAACEALTATPARVAAGPIEDHPTLCRCDACSFHHPAQCRCDDCNWNRGYLESADDEKARAAQDHNRDRVLITAATLAPIYTILDAKRIADLDAKQIAKAKP